MAFSQIHLTTIYPTSLSDHSVFTSQITLTETTTKATRWHFNTMLLSNKEYSEHFKSTFKDFISDNNNSVGDPRVLWGAIKGFIRKTTIFFASHLNRTRLGKISMFENVLQKLEQAQQANGYSDARRQEIGTVKANLNSLLRTRAKFQIHVTRTKYYFNSTRPGRLLSLSLQKCEKFSNITAISSNQKLLTSPKEINTAFQTFYAELYRSEINLDKTECESFLQDLNLPTLMQEDAIHNTIPHILDTFDKFSSLSGYKINWSKSPLFPLNSRLDPKLLPQHIPIVKQFKYLGVDIFPLVASIASKNFLGIYNKIQIDLDWWSYLPKSLQARVSIIKMDILPRINFFSSMLPLPPPAD